MRAEGKRNETMVMKGKKRRVTGLPGLFQAGSYYIAGPECGDCAGKDVVSWPWLSVVGRSWVSDYFSFFDKNL
ncbi:MAG: hypothetical protein OP8BY_1040 [Candidatus Saccharicenans subterraneus]|uniref:Uncharacterized protein n=1 Tax=Candidatus Saccharicenans subterraneus TaxID=2508984 RepID=A0A3E2BQU6_9BACT|nr:MAG: hypothetical protein OP8BY_1040 [Candidatus Saccharicenans subterraneum]